MNSNKSIPREDFFTYSKNVYERFKLSSYTIGRYLRCVESVSQYMEDMGVSSYDLAFSTFFRKNATLTDTSPNQRKSKELSCALTLIDRAIQGLPYAVQRSRIKAYEIPSNEIGYYAKRFIELIKQRRIKNATFLRYQHTMSNIVNQLSENGYDSPSAITRDWVVDFISTHKTADNWYFCVIGQFLNYLAEQKVISISLANLTAGKRPPIPKPLPSYYTTEEVKRIESSVDRGTSLGKRNYAMILLASRLGLRTSDICQLRLENLDWKNNRIRINQSKTGKELDMPLLAEVGNAVIDYLKHARPKTTSKEVFLTFVEPYRTLSAATFSAVVGKAIHRAGIETIGRHVGAHTLRHSLATSMMKNGSGIETISEALGHSGTRVTMKYLNIDIQSLMECSHDVPPVDESYYTQKGGAFYV